MLIAIGSHASHESMKHLVTQCLSMATCGRGSWAKWQVLIQLRNALQLAQQQPLQNWDQAIVDLFQHATTRPPCNSLFIINHFSIPMKLFTFSPLKQSPVILTWSHISNFLLRSNWLEGSFSESCCGAGIEQAEIDAVDDAGIHSYATYAYCSTYQLMTQH